MTTPETLPRLFRFWLPLQATWLMMSVEGPFLAAVIARLPEPKFNLAAYGVAFALIMGPDWFAAPRFLPAWIFGLATLAFGWFLLQPGLGLGWAASKAPNPTKVRLLNLAGHTVFGLGLWLTGLVIG